VKTTEMASASSDSPSPPRPTHHRGTASNEPQVVKNVDSASVAALQQACLRLSRPHMATQEAIKRNMNPHDVVQEAWKTLADVCTRERAEGRPRY